MYLLPIVLNVAKKAQALKEQYPEIEIVKASLDDPESLREALKGVYGVFGVTNYWEHGADGETRQGCNLVDAAKENGVKHFVWSTLDGIEPQVPHWVSKWKVDGLLHSRIYLTVVYLKKSGVPRTSLYTAMYYENFLSMMKPKKLEGDTYLLPIAILPDCLPLSLTVLT